MKATISNDETWSTYSDTKIWSSNWSVFKLAKSCWLYVLSKARYKLLCIKHLQYRCLHIYLAYYIKYSLFHFCLLWCCLVSLATQLKILECLHSMAISSVVHVKQKLSSCFVNSILEHRGFCSLVQIFKILHQILASYLHNLFCYARNVTDREGHNPHHLFVPYVRTNYRKSSLYCRGTFLWKGFTSHIVHF